MFNTKNSYKDKYDAFFVDYTKVSSSMLSYAYLPILTHLVCLHMLTYQPFVDYTKVPLLVQQHYASSIGKFAKDSKMLQVCVCSLFLRPSLETFPGNLPWKPPSLEGRSYVYGARARSLARSPLPSPYTPQLPLLRRTTSRSSIVCRTALTCSLRLTASTSQLCLPRTGACSPSTLPLLLPWGFTPAASGGEFYFFYRYISCEFLLTI